MPQSVAFSCETTMYKHTKVDMIWVAGRSPTLVSHSLRGVAMNLKATTLTYLAIWGTNVGLRPATHIMSTFVCLCMLSYRTTLPCLTIGQGLQVKANVANLFEMTINPIEHQWHRIKQRVRKTRTSTTQNLHDLIDSVICSICQPLPA